MREVPVDSDRTAASPQLGARRLLRTAVLAALALACAVVLSVAYIWWHEPAFEQAAQAVENELARGHWQAALTRAERLLQRQPCQVRILLCAAEAATRLDRTDDALMYYARVQDDGSPAATAARFGAGEVLVHRGRLSEGELHLRRALRQDPQHILALRRLAFVLGITGRAREAVPLVVELIRLNQCPPPLLLLLGDIERTVDAAPHLELCRRAAPDDPLPLLGAARMALEANHAGEAALLLKTVVASLPESSEAQARLGSALLASAAMNELIAWHDRLPDTVAESPEIWSVRGDWALQQGDPRGAVRCFWQAVRLEPDNRRDNYRLGQTLVALGETERAAPFLERADRLQKLALILNGLYQSPNDLVSMQRAALLTESLGRLWEAWGWSQAALALEPNLAGGAAEIAARIRPRLTSRLPRTLPDANPARTIDLSRDPLPSFLKAAAPLRHPHSMPAPAAPRFADQAASAGINFTYFNGADATQAGPRIYETTGGGVAVLDYDGDFWPDLYFSQGTRGPPNMPQSDCRDCLFRNLGNGRFAPVAGPARLGDERFSQGCTAGDFDNDGFPDLYVANLGPNRLYRNEGDGTFSEATPGCGIDGDLWTTSCVMADLNGDGAADIFDVNYAAGPRVLTLVCRQNNIARSCSPLAYDAAPDQLFLSLGDGAFQNATARVGIELPNGYGLGVIAADFFGTGRLDLFIANDQTDNFMLSNQTPHLGGPLLFSDCGLTAGVAVNGDGKSQASMGGAAGDADGDGRLDLFVTNFYQESSILYLQRPGRYFVDATRSSGLFDPTFDRLGFGTQFLDGDLDGQPDLVQTNGHVHDLSGEGKPFHMAPQYFQNQGGGRFVEVSPTLLGPYFEQKSLGRGLARLDWNRDGREDFAVSHIGARAALVTNETAAGHYLAVHLRGVASARDAIGATLRLKAGPQSWVRQLTAGDGYEACNQRLIVFGLGTQEHADELHVRWPSGREQSFGAQWANTEILIREGQPSPVLIVPR